MRLLSFGFVVDVCNCACAQVHELSVVTTTMANFNEIYAWHGTPRENRDEIMRDGFDMRMCTRGIYGKGIYLSPHSSKSDIYTREAPKSTCGIFLVSAHLGRFYEQKDRCSRKH
jgi:hypothetical protein